MRIWPLTYEDFKKLGRGDLDRYKKTIDIIDLHLGKEKTIKDWAELINNYTSLKTVRAKNYTKTNILTTIQLHRFFKYLNRKKIYKVSIVAQYGKKQSEILLKFSRDYLLPQTTKWVNPKRNYKKRGVLSERDRLKGLRKKWDKEYRKDNKEQFKLYGKTRREKLTEKQKEEIKDYMRKYKIDNKEKIEKRYRKYYKNNKRKMFKIQKQWKLLNKDKVKKIRSRYYQKNKKEILIRMGAKRFINKFQTPYLLLEYKPI